jgi:hypothetical protein
MQNVQLPFPSFEDIRKALQFWFDQQDKWFYFEVGLVQGGTSGRAQSPNPIHDHALWTFTESQQTIQYRQTRLVGRIRDVVSFPPSLLLSEAEVLTVDMTFFGASQGEWIVASEKRERYGLVFSQITYYEPINDIESFRQEDPRVKRKGADSGSGA